MEIVEWSENMPEVGGKIFLVFGIVVLIMITTVMFINYTRCVTSIQHKRIEFIQSMVATNYINDDLIYVMSVNSLKQMYNEQIISKEQYDSSIKMLNNNRRSE